MTAEPRRIASWSFLAKLKGRDDVRHAGWLTAAAIAGQVVTLASMPLLARMFDPSAFANFAVLVNLSMAVGSIAGLCYEVAILLPRSTRMAKALTALTLLCALTFAFAFTALLFVLSATWPSAFAATLTPMFNIFCGVGVFATLQLNAINYVQSRAGLFADMAISKFNQSAAPSVLQVAVGLITLSPAGLLIGRTLGVVATNLIAQWRMPAGWRNIDLKGISLPALIVAARRYCDFLLHVPRQLLVRGAAAAPAILLLAAYGAVPAGLFFLAQRVVERPGALLADSLSRVPFREFNARRNTSRPLTRAALIYTGLCSAPVLLGCALIALTSSFLIPFIFGPQWAPASGYVVVMAWWAGVRLSALPMGAAITALRKQGLSLAIDAVFALRVLVFPAMHAWGYDALTAVIAFCLISIAYDVTVFVVGLVLVSHHDRSLLRARNGAK